jgi:hypothetical protein
VVEKIKYERHGVGEGDLSAHRLKEVGWHHCGIELHPSLSLSLQRKSAPSFEFQGDTDGTREVPKDIDHEEVKQRVISLCST